MKGSAVVRGFKAFWIGKIHPQLPLNPKESSRLLAALKSSFRKHLDEVHPAISRGEGERQYQSERSGLASIDAEGFRSSAALADRHLASVLTNPLLAQTTDAKKRAELDYVKAKAALARPGVSPIALLEAYHSKGIATIPIATLCLQSFYTSIQAYEEDAQQRAILESRPGGRTLKWFQASGLLHSASFVEYRRIMELLPYFLLREGLESQIWDWLQQDMGAADQPTTSVSPRNLASYKYRWKGYLLRSMIATKLHSRFCSDKSIDTALDSFFHACDIRRPASNSNAQVFLPLGPAGAFLRNALTADIGDHTRTDPARIDRFLDTVPLWCHPSRSPLDRAFIQLCHPVQPTAVPAYDILRRIFPTTNVVKVEDKVMEGYLLHSKTDRDRQLWAHFFARTTSLLADHGYHREAEWADAKIREKYPEYAEVARRDKGHGISPQATRWESRHNDEGVSHRIPFPTLG